MANGDLERRIYHYHSYKSEGSSKSWLTGLYRTEVKRGEVIRTHFYYDNGVGERTVTIPRNGWKAMVVQGGYESFALLHVDDKVGKPKFRELRGLRNLPFHPKSLVGVGYPTISDASRSDGFVKAENWFTWQGRRLRARLSGR